MRDGFGVHTAEGALGGAIGTLFLDRMMRATHRLPEKLKPTATREHPGEFVVSRAERLLGRPLDAPGRERLVQGLHWAYGIAWGGLFGLLTARMRIRRLGEALLSGAALGSAVWAVGYAGWLPLARLTPPVQRQGARHAGMSLVTHIAYGVASAVPLYLMDRIFRKRPWYERALDAIER